MSVALPGQSVEVAHLTFKPPFAPGSYNRLVGEQLNYIADIKQAAISYWDKPVPAETQSASVLLVNSGSLSLRQRAILRLPTTLRERRFNGVMGQKGLVYLWEAIRLLRQLQPKVIVCYDSFKFGAPLRQHINWPCRLVLSQHGLSYFLSADAAARAYSLKSFDAVWVLTRAAYNFNRQHITAYEPSVRVLPNWIDTETFKPALVAERQALRMRWSLPPEAPVVLWLSRLVPKKGAHVILQSWPRVLRVAPNAVLWIVGSGEADYELYLKKMAVALGIQDKVRFQGFVAPELTPLCYQAADIYVFPTLFTGEGFGLSLLEGLASGLACVASDHAILRELYTEEVVRLVPNPNLEDAFVAPLVALIHDEAQRQQLGAAGRAYVVEHYRREKVLVEIADFYRRQINLAGGSK